MSRTSYKINVLVQKLKNIKVSNTYTLYGTTLNYKTNIGNSIKFQDSKSIEKSKSVLSIKHKGGSKVSDLENTACEDRIIQLDIIVSVQAKNDTYKELNNIIEDIFACIGEDDTLNKEVTLIELGDYDINFDETEETIGTATIDCRIQHRELKWRY